MNAIWTVLLMAMVQASAQSPDWKSIPLDVIVPDVTQGPPAPGKRVPQTTAGWECTEVHHLLTLPTDWKPGKKYPVIIEYAGNGYYADARGDTCDGSVEGCVLGGGISAGKGFIWATLPFVEMQNGITQNAPKWWGDIEESKRYTIETVRDICARYGGDAQRVILCGFSRGSIACNFIGLHDDEIAKLWCGFVCHSHYDGARRWTYEGGSQAAALERLKRLGNRPQWISHEGSTAATEKWLQSTGITGNWTFVSMPFPNHSSAWVMRNMPERRKLREWVAKVIKAVP